MKIASSTIYSFLLYLTLTLSVTAQTIDSTQRKKSRSPFADTQELTSSDYLAAIDRANDLINGVREDGQFHRGTQYVFKEISNTNETINLITRNIRETGNTNLRNQRMYEKVLLELQEQLKKYQQSLDTETAKITGLKKHLRTNMKDTVFRKLVKDSLIRMQYKPQLSKLRTKFFATDSLLKRNLNILNTHKSENTRKKIIIAEALVVVDDRLEQSGVSIFRSECPYLWNANLSVKNQSIGSFIAQKFSVEVKAFRYYLGYSIGGSIALLILMGLLFFFLRYNLQSLKAFNKVQALEELEFRALNQGILLPVVVIGLNIAIALNLYAPALYIEFLHLLLLIVLCVLFRKWPSNAYRSWVLLVIVFAALSFIDLFLSVTLLQRCLFIGINVLCLRMASRLAAIKEQLFVNILFRYAVYLFITLNVLAILFNLFGRVSMAYTLSLTAIIALTQAVALSVLLRVVIEIIILQVYATRLRRGITTPFDSAQLAKNVQKPFLLIIVYLWILLIASNLNLSDTLYRVFDGLFSRQNKIGSFTFTIGGIVLFVFIIWIAHLLQKLASYFFGGIEGEFGENINKRQVSRLLITRLAVIVSGYLLALAASGMPIDKITIVLGALGVGVGLGLQSVVSNFVGGVILIFERPIQVGDMIDSGTQSGRVSEIGLRTTRLQTRDGAEVIIPNGNILAQNIVNWTRTDNFREVAIAFKLTGDITPEAIREVVTAAVQSVPELSKDEIPEVLFDSVSDKRYSVKARFRCNIYKTDLVISEVRMALYKGFGEREVLMED